MNMNLVGDIGGTRTRLALADAQHRLHEAAVFLNDDYPDFPALLGAWLATLPQPPVRGCLAVAGPANATTRSLSLTNRPDWQIDLAVLESRFDLQNIRLANDFAAAAMGVPACADTAQVLQAGVAAKDGACLVIGAGTGLGVAVLVPNNGGYQVLPGEGGHFGFAPQNEVQDALCRHLRLTHGRVITEHVVSGGGLAAIHAFLHKETLTPAQVAQAAGAGETKALDSFDLFAAAYGAVAGDYALASMSRGGIFLAGGIAAANIKLMQRGAFLDAFRKKGVYADLVSSMPVSILTDPLLGLHGAARLA
jgi:glucokinase